MADLGKILLMPKGEYSASYTYSYLDVVTYQRSSYVCKVGSSLNVVPTNTTNWQLLSPHGEDAYGFGYIRYSEYSDGTDFVSTPTSETKYVGFYMGNSPTPPTDKEDYDWSKFVGENGQDGSDGQNGNVWGTGTDITTTGTRLHGYAGVIGDCYLNTETSNVYQCTKAGTSSTAEWSYICNIKGASGSGSGDMDKATYASNAVAQGLSNVVDNALGLYGLTATIAELNYVDGVTSNVQTQIDGKIDSPVSSVGADKVPVSKSGGGYEWKEYGGGGSGVEIDDSTTSSSKVWSSSKTNTAIEAHHDSTKVDVVSGKVLSDNNYSNADKAIVGGVTSALAGKADSATTLAGYGIADAYTKTEVDTSLNDKANTSQLDEWTAEQTLGANNTVTFSGLNDNLAYDLYCDAVGAGIQSITKSGTSLTYVLTGSNLLVGTTKCKLRIVK